MQSTEFNPAKKADTINLATGVETASDGRQSLNLRLWAKAVGNTLFKIGVIYGVSNLAVLAQNPFSTAGDQSLGSLVSNVLVIAAWLALAVGILSFMTIPIAMKMKWDWMNNLYAGIFGVGGWGIAGSLGYILANNQDVNLPTLNQ